LHNNYFDDGEYFNKALKNFEKAKELDGIRFK